MTMPKKRVCTKCGEDLSPHNTYMTKRGLYPRCKACLRSERMARYSATKRREDYEASRPRLSTPEHRAIQAVRAREYRRGLSAEQRANVKINLRRRNRALRSEAFLAYGGAVCVCCGEADHEVLSLDHTDNDGKAHRSTGCGKGSAFYTWLKARNWPQSPRLQVLCWNCNWAKKNNGGEMPWRRKMLRIITG